MTRPKLASLAKAVAARLFGLEVVPLPALPTGAYVSGSKGHRLLPLRYTYRASSEGRVCYQVPEAGQNLVLRLYTMAFAGGRAVPGKLCLTARADAVARGATVEIDLLRARARLDGEPLPVMEQDPHPSRKFITEIQLTRGGRHFRRFCSHYLPFDDKPIGRDYYFGDDYVDYPAQTEVGDALRLVTAHCSAGRLLDIGCALGVYTKAFLDAGFDAHGVDISEFATGEAIKRVGPGRVRQANLDEVDIPFDGAFNVFWMWDVLEHSRSPGAVLEKVTRRAAEGACLFIHTSNADSLMHRLMGRDWEGYSDYSHYGVDQISAGSLARSLDEMAWEVLDWQCGHIWVGGADPVLLRVRDAFHRIPELGVFLAEHNLGDMITVVARKR